MKKLIALLAAVLLCANLGGCTTIILELDRLAADEYLGTDGEGGDIGTYDTSETEKPQINIEETLLYEQNGVRLTAMSLEYDKYSGFELDVLIENICEDIRTVDMDGCSVNGVMIHSSILLDLAAGKKSTVTLEIQNYEMEKIGISSPDRIDFFLTVRDGENNRLEEDLPVNLQITDKTEFMSYGGNEVYNDGQFRVLTGAAEIDSYGCAYMPIVIENSADYLVAVEMTAVSVNDFAVNPFFYCQVAPGRIGLDSLEIYSHVLENNSITELEKLEFTLVMRDITNWSGAVESQPITVTVE